MVITLYLYEFSIQPLGDYSCAVKANTSNCLLVTGMQECWPYTCSFFWRLFESRELCNCCQSCMLFKHYFGNVYLNWLNLFLFLILVEGPLVVPMGCMIFLLLFRDVIEILTPTLIFLVHTDCGILCLYSLFLWLMI